MDLLGMTYRKPVAGPWAAVNPRRDGVYVQNRVYLKINLFERHAMDIQNVTCKQCGSQNPSTSTTCMVCGTRLSRPGEQTAAR